MRFHLECLPYTGAKRSVHNSRHFLGRGWPQRTRLLERQPILRDDIGVGVEVNARKGMCQTEGY